MTNRSTAAVGVEDEDDVDDGAPGLSTSCGSVVRTGDVTAELGGALERLGVGCGCGYGERLAWPDGLAGLLGQNSWAAR